MIDSFRAGSTFRIRWDNNESYFQIYDWWFPLRKLEGVSGIRLIRREA